MAKPIIDKKAGFKNYSILVSAEVSQKKLLDNLEKLILSAIKDKNSGLVPDKLTISVDGVKKVNTNIQKMIIILMAVFGTIFLLFKYFSLKNIPPIVKKPPAETITIQPVPTVGNPRTIDRKVNIKVLNATYSRNIALNLKRTLNQNKFEAVTIGNSRQRNDYISIEYKPGYKYEADYLQNNYLGLSNAVLSEVTATSSANDIVVTLGKSYLSK